MEKVSSVVVVGAGPVGFLTALGLARAGVSVTVVEAEAGINDSPRAAVYFPTTVAVLDGLGLMEDVERVAFKSTTFSYRVLATGEVVRVDTADSLPPNLPYTYNAHFGQHILAEMASRHLLRLPNTQVLWNTKVIGLSQNDAGITLTCNTPSGHQEIKADWVVGADGARSAVRHSLGLAFEGHTWPERFVATNLLYPFDQFGFEPANMIVDPVHWAVAARLGLDNMWRMTYAEDASLDPAESVRRVPEHYAVLLPDPSIPAELIAASPYRVHERCAPTFRVGRALLAGDAAHACNPCGGMGLTGGVLDSQALVQVLSAVIKRNADESVLDFYSTERRRVFLEVSSPVATQYKQQMCESDPARQNANLEQMRQMVRSADKAMMATTLSRLVQGRAMPV
jgi:2-polyprenyl-6-methoxyphenol hydroxylase-like FAD-dependent oxidoreductase